MIVNPVLYQQGVKLPELTNPGTAADLLTGKQLVDQYGNPLTGTMPTATHPKPTLSRSGGTVTAQHVQSAGYTDGGTTTETLTIPTKAGTTITPGTSRKTAVSSGYLTTGAVYVAGDTNLKAENIKSGVSIFGVAGSAQTQTMCSVTFNNPNNYNVSWGVLSEDYVDISLSSPDPVVQVPKGLYVIDYKNRSRTYNFSTTGAVHVDDAYEHYDVAGAICHIVCVAGNGTITVS